MDKDLIVSEIHRMFAEDQELRQRCASTYEIEAADALHAAFIKKLIDTVGLITISGFGKETSYKAWLLIQHLSPKDITYMEKYLQLQEKYLEDIDRRNFAYLKDRIALYKGVPQEFGTQCVYNEKLQQMQFHRIKDIHTVDKRREEYGLDPLYRYAATFKAAVSLPEGYPHMHAIFLSGNSLKNKDFIESLKNELEGLFESSQIQYYKHWSTGENIIDLENEITALTALTSNSGSYVIIAKSAGVLVTLNALSRKLVNPIKCIFLGTPVDWARKQGFGIDTLLNNYSLPTLFIQNKKDPMFSSDDLRQLLEKSACKNYRFAELDGDTHEYTNYVVLKSAVDVFLNKG